MDERSFRLANVIVGNPETTAALELTVNGPTLRFNMDATIGLAGARMTAKLDGAPVAHDAPVTVRAGQTLDHRQDRRRRTALLSRGARRL